MSGFQTNRELAFDSYDLSRPRMAVEKEKMQRHFPSFNFYGSGGRVTSVQGSLHTNYGNKYHVKVVVGSNYPYDTPTVHLPHTTFKSDCPHKFSGDQICIMRNGQWSSSLSLAFVVAKAAIWVNKYDSWISNGQRYWPGRGQLH